jgi:malonyl-CoA decarboxylase
MSSQGIASSYGVMVNYLYDLKDVETNHEAFVSQGKIMLSDALAKKIKQFAKD